VKTFLWEGLFTQDEKWPSRCSPSLKLLESNSDTAWRRKALIHFKSKTLLKPGKTYWRERVNTVDLLVLTSLDQLLFTLKILFSFFFTKQAPLMRKSIVLSLSLQLLFPAPTLNPFTHLVWGNACDVAGSEKNNVI